MAFQSGRDFSEVDPQALGAKAAREAAEALHGSPVPAGSYRIILRWDAMQALLETFCGIFSAENGAAGHVPAQWAGRRSASPRPA